MEDVIRRIERAFKTLKALPDNESKWVYSCKAMWPEYKDDHKWKESTKVIPFQPSAKDVDDCLPVLGVLTAYENEGPKANKTHVEIMRARALDIPPYKIMQRLESKGVHFGNGKKQSKERNYRRMVDAAYADVYLFRREFWDGDAGLAQAQKTTASG